MDIMYNYLDLVWAKMTGYPPWPGRITSEHEPCLQEKRPKDTGNTYYPVVFFGSSNAAWISTNNLWHYQPFKKDMTIKGKGKGKNFWNACKLAEEQDLWNGQHLTTESAASTSVPPGPSTVITSPAKVNDSIPSLAKMFPGVFSDLMDISSSEQENSEELKWTPNFGFLGLGRIGHALAKNLLLRGKRPITVWNRTPEKCHGLVAAGAQQALSPADAISKSDIIFSCVSNTQAAKELFYAENGILKNLTPGVGYVQMTTIDLETSKEFQAAVTSTGARYLEAQLFGSQEEAEKGTLLVVCTGDETLFNDCCKALRFLSENIFYDCEQPGSAIKTKVVLQVISGIIKQGIAEAVELAESADVDVNTLLKVAGMTSMASELVMKTLKYLSVPRLEAPRDPEDGNLHNDLQVALAMGHNLGLPLECTALANERLIRMRQESSGEKKQK